MQYRPKHGFIGFEDVWLQSFDCSRIEHDTTELAFLELHWLPNTQTSDFCCRQSISEYNNAGYARNTYNEYC